MESSIQYWYDLCYQLFASLRGPLDDAPQYQAELSTETLLDLSGRFNIWAGNIGAGGQGRASLDYRLREAIQSIVTGARLPFDNDQNSFDTESSASSSSDDSIISGSPSIGAVNNEPVRTELQFISNLYKISVVIRKHTVPRDRLVKSAKIDTSFYEYFDEKHVREKYPLADEALVKRLGNANSRRRKYFKYREQHRQKLSSGQDAQSVDQNAVGETVNRPVVGESPNLPLDLGEIDAITHDDQTRRTPAGLRESTAASTFRPPDVSQLYKDDSDRVSEAGTQTSYWSTSSIRRDTLAIPPPPKSSLDGRDFECPYCFMICCLKSADPWQQHMEWKRHVLQDIQPYICTFGGCPQTDTLFERRRDWIAHELQRHRTEWCCNVPGHSVYGSHQEFQSHMQHQHRDSIDDSQLDSLTKMVARPAVNLKFSCPLCCSERFNELSIDRLEQHLGRHLEVTATFSLPQGRMENSESQYSATTQNANPSNRSSSDTGNMGIEDLSDVSGVDSRSQSSDKISTISLSNAQEDVIDDLDEDWGFLPAPVFGKVEPSIAATVDSFAAKKTPALPVPNSIEIANTRRVEETCDWLVRDAQARMFARFATMEQQPGNGARFLQSEPYLQWRRADLQVLIVEGLAGCGKTILATSVIEQLRKTSQCYAFFFFEQELASQLPLEIPIRSLVAQLVRRNGQVPSELQYLYESCIRGIPSPSLDQLLGILQIMFRQGEGETFLVLDGLEVVNSQMLKMIVWVIVDAMIQGDKVRLFATSRISPIVEKAISFGTQDYHEKGFNWLYDSRGRDWHNRCSFNFLNSSHTDEGILSQSAKDNEEWLLKKKAIAESRGIFTWACAYLDDSKRGGRMETSSKVPLEDMWTDILTLLITQAGPEHVASVRQVLCTLAICEKRLNAEEIHEILGYDLDSSLLKLAGQPEIDNGDASSDWTEHLGLTHASLKGFLLSGTIRNGPAAPLAVDGTRAQREIAGKCVLYLTQNDNYNPRLGWAAYAGRYWHVHIRKSDSESFLVSNCTRLLHHQSPTFAHWTSLYRREDQDHEVEDDDFAKSDVYPS
ncbi:MAG: hypothetical protein LQ352_003857 [Teloschistes flavicans]|nr:MAG: hypothetical protein LQ352_003857 [Teloschistes flavicans]